jgi:hypothetical protein
VTAKILYQTLENRGNYNEVERDGPYPCLKSSAWLSFGYYFWDAFIENAHWWGEKGYAGNYIICQAQYDFESNSCFDLVGNTDHIKEFTDIWKEMERDGRFGSEIVVADVIHFLRENVKEFNYKAVRASSIDTRRNDDEYSLTIKYRKDTKYKQRLDLRPLIQICILKKGTLILKKLSIVYPNI